MIGYDARVTGGHLGPDGDEIFKAVWVDPGVVDYDNLNPLAHALLHDVGGPLAPD